MAGGRSKDRKAKSKERRAEREEQMLHQLRLYYGDNNLRALHLALLPIALCPSPLAHLW